MAIPALWRSVFPLFGRYIVFHGKRHPMEMGATEVAGFLTHLAERAGVSASTQNQALCALLFLYRRVLERTLEPLAGVAGAAQRAPANKALQPASRARKKAKSKARSRAARG